MPYILMFVQRPYPNDHAVLENVFTYHLPKVGYEPVWVLQPKTPEQNGIRAKWNETPVYVTKRKWWKGKFAIIFRSFELLYQYIKLGTLAMKEYPIEIIQARTGIPEALAGLWLSRRYKKPFVFQNSFPRELQHQDWFRKRHLYVVGEIAYRVDSLFLTYVMRQASLSLVISQTMRDNWQSKGIKHIEVFPLGANTQVDPEQVQPIELPSETVIYFGSMEGVRNLNFLLETFALLLKKLPLAHLLMVGNHTKSGLEEYSKVLNIQNSITFTGHVPRNDVPRYIRAARCAVSPIPPIPMYILSSPTKVLESLAMAVPVVANCEIHDQRELIQASNGGYIPAYDRQAIAEALLNLLLNPEDAARRGQAGREYIKATRSYDTLSQKLIGYYDDMFMRIKHSP